MGKNNPALTFTSVSQVSINDFAFLGLVVFGQGLQYLSEQITGTILPISWSTINDEKPLSVGYTNISQH